MRWLLAGFAVVQASLFGAVQNGGFEAGADGWSLKMEAVRQALVQELDGLFAVVEPTDTAE